MSRQIICSVGTSLQNNYWTAIGTRSREIPPVDPVKEWLKTADPAIVSAETNTLRALEVDDQDKLIFLHSDTPDGEFCAEMLREYYRGKCYAAELEKIAGLNYHASRFDTGMKSLVDIALRRIRQARQDARLPVLCATGGFKPETAFLNLLGALLEVEVVYIHERHRELVTLARLPLSWDTGFALTHREFFEWIDSEPPRRRSGELAARGPCVASAGGIFRCIRLPDRSRRLTFQGGAGIGG